jgi:hypothetical protein
MAADTRRQAIATQVVSISGTAGFDDPEHPVFMAFDWLVEEDTLRLCPDDANLLQRYVLALLYFSTGGDNWIKCRRDGVTLCQGENFLSNAHECEWGGITCDSLDRIQKLNLGK